MNKKCRYNRLLALYGEKNIEYAFEFLSNNNKQILILTNGLSKEKAITAQEACKQLNIDGNPNQQLTKAFIELEKILITLQKENKHTKENQKDKLEDLYDKYGKEKINLILESLSQQERNIIKLNNEKNYSDSEICDILKIKTNTPSNKIKYLYTKIERLASNTNKNKKLNKLYDKYGIEKVDTAIKRLTLQEQAIVKLQTESEIKYTAVQICQILNISFKRPSQSICDIYKKLEAIINKERKNKLNLQYLYDKHGIEKTNAALEKLSDQEKNIIKLDSNQKIHYSRSQICDQLDIITTAPASKVYYTYKKLESLITKQPIQLVEKEQLKNLYSKYGKEKVDIAFNMLKEQDKKIIKMHNSIDPIYTNRQICKILNINYQDPCSAIEYAYRNLKKILNRVKRTKYHDLCDKYGEEVVNSIIETLPNSEQKIIKMLNGLYDGFYYSHKEINRILNIDKKYRSQLKHSIYKDIEDKINGIEYNTIDTQPLNNLCTKYSPLLVEKAISKLNDKDKDIIHLIINSKHKTTKEICHAVNLFPKDYNTHISSLYIKLETIILNMKIENAKSRIATHNKKDFIAALNNINDDNNKKIMFSYYGINKQKSTIKKLTEIFEKSALEIKKIILIEQEKIINHLEQTNK